MNLSSVKRSTRLLMHGPLTPLRPYNICMWHAGRCGSTVIGDMLNQHNKIFWGSEVLEQYSRHVETGTVSKEQAWHGAKRLLNRRQMEAGARIFGIEMKYWHLARLNIEPEEMLEYLEEHNYIKHIILERSNYLRICVSGRVARSTSQLHRKNDAPHISAQVELNTRVIEKTMRAYSKFFNKMKQLLDDYLLITYEDHIVNDPKIAYQKIIEFLGLKAGHVNINFARTNPAGLRDIVSNIAEVQDYFKDTEFEWMVTKEL
jgi:hypothetical protein